jgi:GTPase
MEPEKYYGNVEYKRGILTNCQDRLYQLSTQLLFRLNEGNGICYYYLGIEDDGSISNISEEELEISLDNLKVIVNSVDSYIDDIEKLNNYFKIKIIKNNKNFQDNFKEIKVLLFGDTLTGKTTFLAYIIKNLVCKKANLFLLNHKHELETGRNSSIIIHYYYYNYNNEKYRFVFFDTPGSTKYKKTTNRLIKKLKFDIILNFNENIKLIFKDDILDQIFINKNLYYINNKNELLEYFIENYRNKINNNINNINNNFIKFIIIKKFYNQDIGTILFGYLEQGYIHKNQKLLYIYNNFKIEITVLSIYIDNKEYNIVNKNYCFTIRINQYIKSTKGIIIS